MTKEKILSKQTITNFSGVEFVKPHNALIAMQEYADQETQRLKDELAYKDKEIEISHNENRRMERHFLETVTVINSLRELQTEDLKQLQSELTEKDKDIEMLKQSVDRHETDYSDLQNRNIFLKEKFDNSLKTVKALSGELTELKEKHKEDVVGFAEYISGLCISNYKSGGSWYLNGGKIVTTDKLLEQYYNETHKTK